MVFPVSKLGNFSLEKDPRQGQPKELDSEDLEASDPATTSKELIKEFNVVPMIVPM